MASSKETTSLIDGERTVREFEGIRLETTLWPFIVIEFPEGRVKDESLSRMLDAFELTVRHCRDGGQKCFIITDLTRIREIPSARQRKQAGAWVERTTGLFKAASLGAASVTPSAVLRGVMTAIYWLQPPPTPTYTVATRGAALESGRAAFEAAKLPLPSGLLDLLGPPSPSRRHRL